MPSILDHKLVRKARELGATRLLRRVHRITHRLPVELREPRRARVLVVAPHMDDEVIGPGGTMARHREQGSSVTVAFCCAGASPEADATRRAEAAAVAEVMKFEQTRHLGYPDGQLSRHEAALGRELAALVRQTRPQQIFCPYPADHHRDHSAAAMGLALAIEEVGWSGEVWSYEVWSPLWPNVAVDISGVVDIKRDAIAMHHSQATELHYVEGTLGLNRYRALRVYVDYAEAFYVTEARNYLELAAQMNTL